MVQDHQDSGSFRCGLKEGNGERELWATGGTENGVGWEGWGRDGMCHIEAHSPIPFINNIEKDHLGLGTRKVFGKKYKSSFISQTGIPITLAFWKRSSF